VTERHLQPDDRLWSETDRIDVTSNRPRPDPNWTYTDQAGHEHHYDKAAPIVPGRVRGYPTLVMVEDETYWCEDCQDEHTDSHLECPICGEHITPGLVGPPLYREYIPGMTHYYLNDEEISPDEYRRLAAEMQP
jgi:hypothetical protein